MNEWRMDEYIYKSNWHFQNLAGLFCKSSLPLIVPTGKKKSELQTMNILHTEITAVGQIVQFQPSHQFLQEMSACLFNLTLH